MPINYLSWRDSISFLACQTQLFSDNNTDACGTVHHQSPAWSFSLSELVWTLFPKVQLKIYVVSSLKLHTHMPSNRAANTDLLQLNLKSGIFDNN